VRLFEQQLVAIGPPLGGALAQRPGRLMIPAVPRNRVGSVLLPVSDPLSRRRNPRLRDVGAWANELRPAIRQIANPKPLARHIGEASQRPPASLPRQPTGTCDTAQEGPTPHESIMRRPCRLLIAARRRALLATASSFETILRGRGLLWSSN
jgi:hypothetical protein